MTLRAATATVTLLLSSILATAQQPVPPFTDPANLRGERVKPRDGRELPIDQGARGLEQMLRKLNTRASLMLIVAHPDDEDGGMLTYYSRGLGARVAVLTLTRGEGGQNAMTGDFEDALGLLRTQELLSADRYLGVDQFFGTEVDFGFSKTKEEAFKKWTHERVLYDAVRSIRLYRPLVIAAVFIGGVTDGHGQHQVSGQIAQEAFKAAADPTVFPDMIAEGILPWQALKVYARVPDWSISPKGLFDYATGKYTAPRFENYVTGEITTTVPSSDVVVHEGTTDKLLSDSPSDPPRTYVQFARIGLGMQKSQIGGGVRVPPAGAFDVVYHLYGSVLNANTLLGRHPEQSEGPVTPSVAGLKREPFRHDPKLDSFFDGIDTSIEGIADLAPSANAGLRMNLTALQASIHETTERFSPENPSYLAPSLATALKRFDMVFKVIEGQNFNPTERANVLHELRVKRVQINDALVLALSLHLDATATASIFPVQSDLSVHTDLSVTSSQPVPFFTEEIETIDGVPQRGPHSDGDSAVTQAKPWQEDISIKPALTKSETRPYFFRADIEKPVYQLRSSSLRNAPTTPNALIAWANLTYNGVDIRLGHVIHSGDQPVQIVPVANLSVQPSTQVLANNRMVSRFQTELHPSLSPALIPKIVSTKDWKASLVRTDVKAEGFTFFQLDAPKLPRTAALLTAEAALPNQQVIAEGYRPIGYGDLPLTNYYTPATVRIVPVDLNLPSTKKIAYLPGTGDAIPEVLASINLKPEILTIADLTPAKLAQYDTVILGVRTYNAHPDLHGAPTQALFEFARNGGNVLVQYQTTEFTADDAPYPLSLGSNEKVVDETDPVKLLDAKAAFLTTPNKITPADFNDWVEERGHGFLSDWDKHYTALTETHDPDQDPQRGGLITTPLGKGRWTYCAFALYRQLPEAVPGAFRLFVNLINPSH
jgi:LmbE family N-acetylglucosaminyl deacetylase